MQSYHQRIGFRLFDGDRTRRSMLYLKARRQNWTSNHYRTHDHPSYVFAAKPAPRRSRHDHGSHSDFPCARLRSPFDAVSAWRTFPAGRCRWLKSISTRSGILNFIRSARTVCALSGPRVETNTSKHRRSSGCRAHSVHARLAARRFWNALARPAALAAAVAASTCSAVRLLLFVTHLILPINIKKGLPARPRRPTGTGSHPSALMPRSYISATRGFASVSASRHAKPS